MHIQRGIISWVHSGPLFYGGYITYEDLLIDIQWLFYFWHVPPKPIHSPLKTIAVQTELKVYMRFHQFYCTIKMRHTMHLRDLSGDFPCSIYQPRFLFVFFCSWSKFGLPHMYVLSGEMRYAGVVLSVCFLLVHARGYH